ncbi:hypothetical protein HUU05_07080 [candidate division KSB1 bacterium]|nr:hypothetical protein [candidate division KSB1 bacterium]
MRKLGMLVVTFVMILTATGSHAQNYNWLSEQAPGSVTQGALDKQVEALLKLFSSLSGSGFVNTAALHQVGGVDVRATFVGAPVPEEFKDIIPTVQDPLEGADFVPFAFLHGNIGLPANFEAYARFMTLNIKGDPGGNVTLLGGGLKYGILRGNISMPDLTVIAGYQTILIPEDFDFGTVSTLSLKAYLSKKFVFITLYGGGGIDRTSLKLKLDKIPLPPSLFNEKYDVNYPQGTVGFTLSPLPLLNINADANFGAFTSFSVGASLSVR